MGLNIYVLGYLVTLTLPQPLSARALVLRFAEAKVLGELVRLRRVRTLGGG